MKAKFNKNAKQVFNPKHRKEQLVEAYRVIDSEFNTLVDCRIYYPKSIATCALWVSGDNGFYTSGTGKAGGWGYHVISAAVDDAIDSAGFELFGTPYPDGREENLKKRTNISGVGSAAIERALLAIAKSVTRKRKIKLINTFA